MFQHAALCPEYSASFAPGRIYPFSDDASYSENSVPPRVLFCTVPIRPKISLHLLRKNNQERIPSSPKITEIAVQTYAAHFCYFFLSASTVLRIRCASPSSSFFSKCFIELRCLLLFFQSPCNLLFRQHHFAGRINPYLLQTLNRTLTHLKAELSQLSPTTQCGKAHLRQRKNIRMPSTANCPALSIRNCAHIPVAPLASSLLIFMESPTE